MDVLGANGGLVGQVAPSSTRLIDQDPGAQPADADRSKLAYGVSITDACIGWDETEALLREAHGRLA